MRARSRTSTATIAETATEAPPAGDEAAVALVDDALRVASRRQLFTRDEVVELLRQVEVAAHDLAVGPRVQEIVEQAERGAHEQLMWSRSELIDPLLDIRSALGS